MWSTTYSLGNRKRDGSIATEDYGLSAEEKRDGQMMSFGHPHWVIYMCIGLEYQGRIAPIAIDGEQITCGTVWRSEVGALSAVQLSTRLLRRSKWRRSGVTAFGMRRRTANARSSPDTGAVHRSYLTSVYSGCARVSFQRAYGCRRRVSSTVYERIGAGIARQHSGLGIFVSAAGCGSKGPEEILLSIHARIGLWGREC